MRKKLSLRVHLSAVALGLVFLLFATSLPAAEKTVEEQEAEAMSALEKSGREDLAALVRLLNKANWGDAKMAIWRFFQDHPGLKNFTPTTPGEVRAKAVAIFQSLGTNASVAAPAIFPLLLKEDTTVSATAALKAIGVPAEIWPVIEQGTTNTNRIVRQMSVHVLAERVAVEPRAVTKAIVMLQDSNSSVRFSAVQALKGVSGDATPAALALTKMLNDPDPRVRQESIMILSAYGMRASNAAPALLKFWETSTGLERSLIENLLLRKLAPEKIPAIKKKSEYE